MGGKKKEGTATTATAMARERAVVVTNSETLVGGNGRGGSDDITASAAAAAIGSRSSSLAIAAAAAVDSTSRSSVSIANDNATSSSSSNGRSGSRLPPRSPLIESREERGGTSKKDKDVAAVAASSGASAAATTATATTGNSSHPTTVRRSSRDISPVRILQNYYSNKTTTTTPTSSLTNIQYPEFYMCTRNEAIDRSNCHELHPLEYCRHSRSSYTATTITTTTTTTTTTKESTTTSSSISNNRRRFRPTYDSRYVVKKYRRSAAGGGTTSTGSSSSSDDYIVTTTTTNRTIDQLSYTVDYLLDIIFVNQYPPPYKSSSKSSTDDDTNDALSPMSLCNVVSFIDDRLRAVQKELVTLLGTTTSSSSSSSSSRWARTIDAKQKQQRGEVVVDEGRRRKMAKLRRTVRHMQVKMIRYGLISTYLLSEVPTTTTISSLERREKSQQKNSISSSSSSYEYTFSIRALRAALTTYMSLCTCIHDDHNRYDSDDDDISRVEYRREVRECEEVTSYVALLHLSGVIYNTEILGIIVGPTTATTTMDVSSPLLSLMDDGGSGYNALLLQLQRQHHQRQHRHNVVVPEKEMEEEEYYHPRLEWTLELACTAQEGNYRRYLSLLESGPTTSIVTTTTTTTKMVEEEAVVDQARFLILARCCISNSLNLIRLGQLRRYNFAYRKEERVSSLDIARLLHFTVCDDNNDTNDDNNNNNNNNSRGDEDYDDEEENDDYVYALQCAIDFCHYSGLPIVDAVIDMNDINQQETKKKKKNCHVVMKSVPISVKGDNAIRMICRPGRMNDSFVFGTRLVDYKQPRQNWDGCSHGKEGVESLSNELVVMNLGDRAEVVTDQTTAAAAATAGCFYARKDGDGVLIPPSNVLRNLIS